MNSNFTLKDQNFILSSIKSIYWKEKEILIISDLHLGKVSHFRKHGIPVPNELININLEKLSSLVFEFKPKTIIFLGDLFHSRLNNEWNIFKKWRETHELIEMILVKGNHDIIDHRLYEETNIKLVEEYLIIDSLIFSHEKLTNLPSNNLYQIYGHIHPGIRLRGNGKDEIKLPCFYFNEVAGIMPAFGEFTGISLVKCNPGDNIFAIFEDKVIKV